MEEELKIKINEVLIANFFDNKKDDRFDKKIEDSISNA